MLPISSSTNKFFKATTDCRAIIIREIYKNERRLNAQGFCFEDRKKRAGP